MSNTVIRAALESRLTAWATAQTPVVKIAYQNVVFTKPADGALFVEPILIPNTITDNLGVTRVTEMGIFQINCWAPSGKGMGAAERLAQSIVALYPVLPKTGTVSVERTPNIERPLLDGSGWVITPVCIHYRLWTT